MPKGASVPSLGLSNQAIYVSNTVDERSNNRFHDDDNYNLANLKSKLCKGIVSNISVLKVNIRI